MAEKRLYRSRSNRMIAGVAGGLAEYFDIDPVIVRVVLVLLALVGHGFIVLAYLVAWVIIPDQPFGTDAATGTGATAHTHKVAADESTEEEATESTHHATRSSSKSRSLLGFILIFLGIVFLANNFIFPLVLSLIALWPVLIIILGLMVIFGGKRKG